MATYLLLCRRRLEVRKDIGEVCWRFKLLYHVVRLTIDLMLVLLGLGYE